MTFLLVSYDYIERICLCIDDYFMSDTTFMYTYCLEGLCTFLILEATTSSQESEADLSQYVHEQVVYKRPRHGIQILRREDRPDEQVCSQYRAGHHDRGQCRCHVKGEDCQMGMSFIHCRL